MYEGGVECVAKSIGFATFCLLSPPKKTISFLYMFFRKIKTRLILMNLVLASCV